MSAAMTSAASAHPAVAYGRPMTIAQHIRRTLALAFPVMVARAGLLIMVAVDTIMTGHAGATELAYYAISMAPQTTMMTVGIGLLVGTVVLTAQADGAGRTADCGRIWRLGLLNAAGLGAIYWVVLQWGEAILLLLGQEPGIAAGGGRTLLMFAPGMPAILLFVATSFFLEGIARPRAGMVVSLSANLVNAGLNWLLIFGHLGLPAMGAAGAALATTVTRWLMVAAMVAYILLRIDSARYGIRAPLKGYFGTARKLLLLGLPLALATGFETSAFATNAIFAGWMGEAALGGYQIALNFLALIYMLTIGLATATAVRVANAVGRQDPVGMGRAGWVGTGLVVALMLVVALLILLGRGGIASLYTSDAAVRSVALAALAIAAWMVIVDGAQGVLMGALRGAADVVVPTAMYFVSFWGLTVPLAYWLGVSAGHGVEGLMWAAFAGLAAATLLLGLRFHGLTGRDIRPV